MLGLAVTKKARRNRDGPTRSVCLTSDLEVWDDLFFTAQNAGPDGLWATDDDLLAPLNSNPSPVSVDHSIGDQQDDPLDRVRSFNSLHPGGAQFALGDGSIQFVSDTIDSQTYRDRSTIAGGEQNIDQ